MAFPGAPNGRSIRHLGLRKEAPVNCLARSGQKRSFSYLGL